MIFAIAFAFIAFYIAFNAFFEYRFGASAIIGVITFIIVAITYYFNLEILFMIEVGILVLALIIALIKKRK